MKLLQLLEGRGWAADMARENRERHRKEREAFHAEEKARKAAEREKAKPKKTPLHTIWLKVNQAISDTFPDGDPLDYIHNWMVRNNVTIADVNKAFRDNGDTGFYPYMKSMWDEHASQAISDARHEFAHLDLRSKDEIIKGALAYTKSGNYGAVQAIIDRARQQGKDYPEFKTIQKSIGDKHRYDVPHSQFFDYDVKTGKFTKLQNPWKST